MIDVVITCYNYGRYLNESINSIINQKFPPKTLTIVDDGSNDAATRVFISNILDKYDFGLINPYVLSTRYQGLSRARNNGIRIGGAPYICCLDADDYISINYFTEILKVFESNSDASIVTPFVQLFGDESNLWKTSASEFADLLLENTYAVSSVFKRSDWDRIKGYDENMKHGYEDWDLWLSILKSGGTGCVSPDTYLFHRKHGYTMTSSAKEKHADIYNYITNKHL